MAVPAVLPVACLHSVLGASVRPYVVGRHTQRRGSQPWSAQTEQACTTAWPREAVAGKGETREGGASEGRRMEG